MTIKSMRWNVLTGMTLWIIYVCFTFTWKTCYAGQMVKFDREGFFNKTSYVKVFPPLNIQHQFGLSFRTCFGGVLLSQSSSIARNQIMLEVNTEGILLTIVMSNKLYRSRLDGNFLDNMWHNVNVINRFGNVTLSANIQHQIISNSTVFGSLSTVDVTLHDKTSILMVGEGFHGCILEGPNIVLNSPSNQFYSVEWGTCPLLTTACHQVNHCINEPCLMHGTCISRADRYLCICASRYAGNNCEIDNGSPCKKGSSACLNNARCEEDRIGNYKCICESGYTGIHCETELSSRLCDVNPCRNNGACRTSPGSNTYECICPSGFTGHDCEVNINECLSNPCQNGGTCTDGINNYTCSCLGTGYTGTNCEVNVNECENKPCLNDGKCFDNYGGYTCQCIHGFSGQNCETQVDECQLSPCQNGGLCRDLTTGYECHCRQGYTGKNCQIILNDCESSPCPVNSICTGEPGNRRCSCLTGFIGIPPNCTEVIGCSASSCKNGGACMSTGVPENPFNCSCSIGFTGKYCEINIDECATNPCQNGATCIDGVNGFSCNCTEDFMGPTCQLPFDICTLGPCFNNATCRTAIGNREYYCQCARGFEGSNCEININDCTMTSCPPGKICIDGINDFDCKCPPGLSGDNCSIAMTVPRCYPNACRHNATCLDTPSGFECKCTSGFTGQYCETDIDECSLGICKNGFCLNSEGSYQCFCTPGYTGDNCEIDFNECLSNPCQNGATCKDGINRFSCVCMPGYTGKDCSVDINECESNPCLNGGTCHDHNANYTCDCPKGLEGVNCETNIDDCQKKPCQNEGICIDGIDSYNCDCSSTGFSGEHCDINIDDCFSNPCVNNATCMDLIKDYKCICYPGYIGKNCEEDINECASNPCQSGGTCLERSNISLYSNEDAIALSKFYNYDFSYANANGYECICAIGLTGVNCETNINECESSPCRNGKCIDEIGGYKCECDVGFEGISCEIDIDECERLKPCVHGTCVDRRADYFCDCNPKYGGKNCSVELIGCNQEPACLNNGTCKPYLIGETMHKFNCTCPHGFYGETCEKITTMSLSGESLIMVNTTREEGYDISFRFKTTLPSGLLAMGKGSTFYILELVNGKLNLHSSLLNKWEGVFIGSELNNSKWQKVFVTINSSHVVLAANEEQTIYPISLNEGASANHTSFPTTYVGGTTPYLRYLTHGPSFFIGCTENIIINGQWIIPEDKYNSPIEMHEIQLGCPRKEQCKPNPCHSGGRCTDLWKNFSCACQRPYLGYTCQYNLTAATFGHENINNSLVIVSVYNQARKAIRNMLDISMFIRTRQSKGSVFYLGSVPGSVTFSEESHVAAELESGELLVRIQLNGTPESYTVGGVKLNDGRHHLIQVIRNVTLIQVKINGTEYFRKTISANGPLDTQILYLGGFPSRTYQNETSTISSTESSITALNRLGRDVVNGYTIDTTDLQNLRYIRQTDKFENVPHFKGIIQDVQISNGSSKMVVEFFPLKAKDVIIPKPFGNVTFDPNTVIEGVVSDDACRTDPCLNDAVCTVTWNDYICHCPIGYKGKQCQEMEFCQLQDCPVGSECRNLNHGYECVANITLTGKPSLKYSLTKNEDKVTLFSSVELMYRSKAGGILLYITSTNDDPAKHHFFLVYVFKDEVIVSWKLDSNSVEQNKKIRKDHPDGDWGNIVIKTNDNKLHGSFSGVTDEPGQYFIENNFPTSAWNTLVTTGTIYVGGGDDSLRTMMTPDKRGYLYETEGSNSIDLFGDISKTSQNFITNSSFSNLYYNGCIGEIRIGGLLLPYFMAKQLNASSQYGRDYFVLQTETEEMDTHFGCYLCFPSDCKNGGSCTNVNESYSCDCLPGFAEDDCSYDIDECVNNKCEHGAICIDGIANYTCQCTSGWTGQFCELDIDECVSAPCLNNGTCIDKLAYFECICPDEYDGKQCENLKQITCDNKPCKNGAICYDVANELSGDNFTCNCSDGFVGNYCDSKFCSIKSCENGGICTIEREIPICKCRLGFTGKYCEKDIDDCEVDVDGRTACLHNGYCIDGINTFDCNCTGTGFTGARCEDDIDECRERIADCGESGICENEEGTYKCKCEENICGYHCHLLDPCIENPCQNGGTCKETCTNVQDYVCICAAGYEGKNCTEKPLYTSSKVADIALIVGPIVAILLIAGGISLSMFIMMARKKRATRGTYSPSSQEYCNPRVEMDNVMKPPPEERLI